MDVFKLAAMADTLAKSIAENLELQRQTVELLTRIAQDVAAAAELVRTIERAIPDDIGE
jgi:hypothetical protein